MVRLTGACSDPSCSEVDLRVLLDRAGVTEEGRTLVDQIRAGEPVRSVGRNLTAVSARNPSRKVGRTVQYESRTAELAFVIECGTSPGVHEWRTSLCVFSVCSDMSLACLNWGGSCGATRRRGLGP